MRLVYSMTRKYLVSPVLEAARLSGGGHVMAAWEAKMSTFPTSPSVGGEEAVVFQAPQESHPMGLERSEVWESGLEARSHFDFV